MFSGLSVNVNECMDTNKKIFWQFNTKSYTQDTALTLTLCMSIAATPTPSKSIFNILTKKKSFPKFKQNATLGTALQNNTIGVKAAYISDYETLVKPLSELLWR